MNIDENVNKYWCWYWCDNRAITILLY